MRLSDFIKIYTRNILIKGGVRYDGVDYILHKRLRLHIADKVESFVQLFHGRD